MLIWIMILSRIFNRLLPLCDSANFKNFAASTALRCPSALVFKKFLSVNSNQKLAKCRMPRYKCIRCLYTFRILCFLY